MMTENINFKQSEEHVPGRPAQSDAEMKVDEQIDWAIQWIIQDYEDSFFDGCGCEVPQFKRLSEEVIEQVLTRTTGDCTLKFQPIEEVRLVSVDFIRERVAEKLVGEGYGE